jgi:hypothetical protein
VKSNKEGTVHLLLRPGADERIARRQQSDEEFQTPLELVQGLGHDGVESTLLRAEMGDFASESGEVDNQSESYNSESENGDSNSDFDDSEEQKRIVDEPCDGTSEIANDNASGAAFETETGIAMDTQPTFSRLDVRYDDMTPNKDKGKQKHEQPIHAHDGQRSDVIKSVRKSSNGAKDEHLGSSIQARSERGTGQNARNPKVQEKTEHRRLGSSLSKPPKGW